jgi:hypothetical protein
MMIRLSIAATTLYVAIVAFGQSIVPKDVDGWSSAKWGMTEKEIKNAFKGEALTSESVDNLIIPDYKIGRSRFKVTFVMDEQTKLLNRVNIIPIDGGPGYDGPVVNPGPERLFDDLKTLLISKYGQPATAGDSVAAWRFKSTTIDLRVSILPMGNAFGNAMGKFLTLNYRQNTKGDLDRI